MGASGRPWSMRAGCGVVQVQGAPRGTTVVVCVRPCGHMYAPPPRLVACKPRPKRAAGWPPVRPAHACMHTSHCPSSETAAQEAVAVVVRTISRSCRDRQVRSCCNVVSISLRVVVEAARSPLPLSSLTPSGVIAPGLQQPSSHAVMCAFERMAQQALLGLRTSVLLWVDDPLHHCCCLPCLSPDLPSQHKRIRRP